MARLQPDADVAPHDVGAQMRFREPGSRQAVVENDERRAVTMCRQPFFYCGRPSLAGRLWRFPVHAGRYGVGSHSWLPEWIDLLVVCAFSLVIYYWAITLTMTREKVQEAIAKDSHQIDYVGV